MFNRNNTPGTFQKCFTPENKFSYQVVILTIWRPLPYYWLFLNNCHTLKHPKNVWHLALLIPDSDNAASWITDGSYCHSRQVKEDFFLLRNAPICSGDHLISYLVRIWSPLFDGKTSEGKADHYVHILMALKMNGFISPLLSTPLYHVLWQLLLLS